MFMKLIKWLRNLIRSNKLDKLSDILYADVVRLSNKVDKLEEQIRDMQRAGNALSAFVGVRSDRNSMGMVDAWSQAAYPEWHARQKVEAYLASFKSYQGPLCLFPSGTDWPPCHGPIPCPEHGDRPERAEAVEQFKQVLADQLFMKK